MQAYIQWLINAQYVRQKLIEMHAAFRQLQPGKVRQRCINNGICANRKQLGVYLSVPASQLALTIDMPKCNV